MKNIVGDLEARCIVAECLLTVLTHFLKKVVFAKGMFEKQEERSLRQVKPELRLNYMQSWDGFDILPAFAF